MTEEAAFYSHGLKKRKYNAETQRVRRIRREEKKAGDVKSPLEPQNDENLWSLEISEFGGLRATQHTVTDEVKFGYQFVGVPSSQRGGVDFCSQQNHGGYVCAASQAIFLESSGEIEQLPVMTTYSALPT